MRAVQNPQMQIGEVDISQIKFDLKSRDDIPKILRGLQHLYMDIPLRTKLFQLLEAEISPKVRILANVNGDSGDREHPTCLHIGHGGFLPQVFTISQDWFVFSVKIPLLI